MKVNETHGHANQTWSYQTNLVMLNPLKRTSLWEKTMPCCLVLIFAKIMISFISCLKLVFSFLKSSTLKHHCSRTFWLFQNAARLDSEIIYDRDFDYDYFGFKTLERSYLLKVQGNVVERPQHMLMRVAVGIHKDDIDSVIKTYHLMSQRWFTHASPTLFNAGTPRPQVCELLMLL